MFSLPCHFCQAVKVWLACSLIWSVPSLLPDGLGLNVATSVRSGATDANGTSLTPRLQRRWQQQQS